MQDVDEQQLNSITQKMEYFFNELILKYETKKYNEAEYLDLITKFECLDEIEPTDIDRILAWKYGKTLTNLPRNRKHQPTLNRIKDSWQDFLGKKFNTGEEIFEYWNSILPTSFITAAFIAHLCKPEEVPIVDQHNFRAVRYFLSKVNATNNLSKNPKTWNEIYLVKEFIDTFANRRSVSVRELDKYLMMFGKHVAPRE